MKKLFAIVLICLLIMPGSAYAAGGSASGAEQHRLLYDLGVMPEKESADINLTRGEFTAHLVRLSGVDLGGLGGQMFTDVEPEYEYFYEIAAAQRLGLVSGTSEKTFHPNDMVTYRDALRMLMRLLGYYDYAQEHGGTEVYAAKIGLTRGVPAGSGYLSVAQYIALIENAVKVDVMTISIAGEYRVEKDRTLLEAYLGLSKLRGQITACAYTALNGKSSLADDKFTLAVKNDTYEMQSSTLSKDEIYELLGYEADVYYRAEGDDYSVVSVIRRSSVDVLEIASSDLEKEATSKTQVVYSAGENQRTETAQVSKSAYVLYNKTAVSDYTDKDFKISDGKIKLIDSDRNGVYDVAVITEYSYTLVHSANSSTESIYDRYGLHNLELKGQKVSLTENGKAFALAELKPGDLVVSEKDKSGRIISARRVMNRTAGKVEELTEDGCTIDGETYLYSNSYKQLLNSKEKPKDFDAPEAGGVICLLLDENGMVAATVAVSAQEGVRYGYLIAMANAKGVSGKVQLRMLTDSGKVVVLKSAERVLADGSSMHASDLMDYFTTHFNTASEGEVREIGRVVKYLLNEKGELTRLDTEYFNAEKENENSSLHCDVDGQTLRWSYDASSFAGYALKGGRTVLFGVPSAMSSDDKSYAIVPVTSLVGGGDYKISAYNLSRGGEAEVICIEMNVDAPTGINTWDPPYVIEKIVKVMNDDGELVQRAYAYGYPSSTEATVLTCQKPGMLDSYQAGDVIRCGFNTLSGEVNNVEKILVQSDMKRPFQSHSNFTTSYWFYYGKVMRWEGNNVCVSFNEDNTDLRYFSLSRPMSNRAHIVYDFGRGKAKSMEMADLVGAENSGNPSWVLLYAWKGEVMDIIAFNNVK